MSDTVGQSSGDNEGRKFASKNIKRRNESESKMEVRRLIFNLFIP